jgi:hypothetical protein
MGRLILIFFLLYNQVFSQTPSWQWAKSNGGSSTDFGAATATDAFGNVYVAGSFYSPTMTVGSTTLTNAGLTDIYLIKYDASGNVLWAKKAGGSGGDWASGLATDFAGNVILVGYYYNTTMLIGTITLPTAGQYDFFYAKYDAAGNLLWAKRGGGTQNDHAASVTTDASGNIGIAGTFHSPGMTSGSASVSNLGAGDAFVLKCDGAGNTLWMHAAGDYTEDGAASISCDAAGNFFVTGIFSSDIIRFGPITLFNIGQCIEEIFIVKYDPAGNAVWARNPAGQWGDYAYGIAADASGNSYITGYFFSNTISFGSINLSNPTGNYMMYVAKYDPSGNAVWVKTPTNGIPIAIALDACSQIYFTAYFGGSLVFGSSSVNSNASGDVLVASYDNNGNELWANIAGGPGWDYPASIAVSKTNGDIYVAGVNNSTPMTFGSVILNSASSDGFLGKLTAVCSAIPLPVELISFTGKNHENKNILQWTTATEINNDYFSIQRGYVAEFFETIGTVRGVGNSNVVRDYSFTDESFKNGINYYRLIQTDYDGTATASDIIAVNSKKDSDIELIQNEESIRIISNTTEFIIRVFNSTGMKVIEAFDQDIIEITNLSAGIYYFNVETKSGSCIWKIFKR